MPTVPSRFDHRRASFALASLLLVACGDWVTTEDEARALADQALAARAQRLHVAADRWQRPEVTTDALHEWVFDYRARDSTVHRLIVRVNGRGRVEPREGP